MVRKASARPLCQYSSSWITIVGVAINIMLIMLRVNVILIMTKYSFVNIIGDGEEGVGQARVPVLLRLHFCRDRDRDRDRYYHYQHFYARVCGRERGREGGREGGREERRERERQRETERDRATERGGETPFGALQPSIRPDDRRGGSCQRAPARLHGPKSDSRGCFRGDRGHTDTER